MVGRWGLGWGLQRSHGALDIRDKHSTAPNQTLLLTKQKSTGKIIAFSSEKDCATIAVGGNLYK